MVDDHIAKPRILIVDDVPENVRMLIEILKDDYAAIPGEMHTVADLFGMPSLRKLGTDKLVRKAAAIREIGRASCRERV